MCYKDCKDITPSYTVGVSTQHISDCTIRFKDAANFDSSYTEYEILLKI